MSETNGPTPELTNEQLYDILRGVTYEADDISLTDGEIWEDILDGVWYTQIACQAYAAGAAELAALREQVTRLEGELEDLGPAATLLDRLRRAYAERDAARAELDAATTGGEWELGGRHANGETAPLGLPGITVADAQAYLARRPYRVDLMRRYVGPWQPAPAATPATGGTIPKILAHDTCLHCGKPICQIRTVGGGKTWTHDRTGARRTGCPAATRDGGGQDGATA